MMIHDADFILPQAILLDMDGTITDPLLDFAAIRAAIGIGNEPILEAMAKMEPARLEAAREILEFHERTAAAASTLSQGCGELLTWLGEHGISTGLVTRNSRDCARIILERHGLDLPVVVTRDDGPYKPDPEAIHLALRQLGVDRSAAWMVGDGSHDVEAGLAAGVRTVWLSLGRERPFAAEPWRVVEDLGGLLAMLDECAGRHRPE